MWLTLAFASAFMLGFYDVAKKHALTDNAVLPILFINTLVSALVFLPFICLSAFGLTSPDSLLGFPGYGFPAHIHIAVKSAIVLTSWILGYFAIKHLPITITGPITATRPVMVLVGAMLFFGERLNAMQWMGIILGFISLFLLSRSGKKEGINFRKDKWIFLCFMAAMAGAASALYDKFLMGRYDPMFVQSFFNLYQFCMMVPVLGILWLPVRSKSTPLQWRWSILFIPLLVGAADFLYFYALTIDGSMISVVSMVRRSSVLISFTFGAILFREKNLGGKALDLLLILIGMIFLYLGS